MIDVAKAKSSMLNCWGWGDTSRAQPNRVACFKQGRGGTCGPPMQNSTRRMHAGMHAGMHAAAQPPARLLAPVVCSCPLGKQVLCATRRSPRYIIKEVCLFYQCYRPADPAFASQCDQRSAFIIRGQASTFVYYWKVISRGILSLPIFLEMCCHFGVTFPLCKQNIIGSVSFINICLLCKSISLVLRTRHCFPHRLTCAATKAHFR